MSSFWTTSCGLSSVKSKKKKKGNCGCSVSINATPLTIITATNFPGAPVDPEDVTIESLMVSACLKCKQKKSFINAQFLNDAGEQVSRLSATLVPKTIRTRCYDGSAVITGIANISFTSTPPVPLPFPSQLPFTIYVNQFGTATFTAGGADFLSISFSGLDVRIKKCKSGAKADQKKGKKCSC